MDALKKRSERLKFKACGAQEPECMQLNMRNPSTPQRSNSTAQ
jgi:hypothetical protein